MKVIWKAEDQQWGIEKKKIWVRSWVACYPEGMSGKVLCNVDRGSQERMYFRETSLRTTYIRDGTVKRDCYV